MTDLDEQHDELMALTEILDEDVFSTNPEDEERGGRFYAHVTLPPDFAVFFEDPSSDADPELHVVEYLPQLVLHFTLPPSYPSTSPPQYTLSCKWLSLTQLTSLCDKLDSLWEENEGMVILFYWTSFLQQEAFDFLQLESPLDLSNVLPRRKLSGNAAVKTHPVTHVPMSRDNLSTTNRTDPPKITNDTLSHDKLPTTNRTDPPTKVTNDTLSQDKLTTTNRTDPPTKVTNDTLSQYCSETDSSNVACDRPLGSWSENAHENTLPDVTAKNYVNPIDKDAVKVQSILLAQYSGKTTVTNDNHNELCSKNESTTSTRALSNNQPKATSHSGNTSHSATTSHSPITSHSPTVNPPVLYNKVAPDKTYGKPHNHDSATSRNKGKEFYKGNKQNDSRQNYNKQNYYTQKDNRQNYNTQNYYTQKDNRQNYNTQNDYTKKDNRQKDNVENDATQKPNTKNYKEQNYYTQKHDTRNQKSQKEGPPKGNTKQYNTQKYYTKRDNQRNSPRKNSTQSDNSSPSKMGNNSGKPDISSPTKMGANTGKPDNSSPTKMSANNRKPKQDDRFYKCPRYKQMDEEIQTPVIASDIDSTAHYNPIHIKATKSHKETSSIMNTAPPSVYRYQYRGDLYEESYQFESRTQTNKQPLDYGKSGEYTDSYIHQEKPQLRHQDTEDSRTNVPYNRENEHYPVKRLPQSSNVQDYRTLSHAKQSTNEGYSHGNNNEHYNKGYSRECYTDKGKNIEGYIYDGYSYETYRHGNNDEGYRDEDYGYEDYSHEVKNSEGYSHDDYSYEGQGYNPESHSYDGYSEEGQGHLSSDNKHTSEINEKHKVRNSEDTSQQTIMHYDEKITCDNTETIEQPESYENTVCDSKNMHMTPDNELAIVDATELSRLSTIHDEHAAYNTKELSETLPVPCARAISDITPHDDHVTYNTKELSQTIRDECAIPVIASHDKHGIPNILWHDKRAIQDIASQNLLRGVVLEFNVYQKKVIFEKSLVMCGVCLCEKYGIQCTQFHVCGHAYCRECMREYFCVQIGDGNGVGITCPYSGCDTDVLPSQVKELVPGEMFAKYDRLLLQTSLQTMVDIVYCPRPLCQSAVIYDRESGMASCPVCYFVFCPICKLTYHGVSPCRLKKRDMTAMRDEYLNADDTTRAFMERRYGKTALTQLLHEAFSEDWLRENSQECPRCSTHIQKIDGCNKMTCTKCRSFFCWLCNTPLSRNNPYDHYNNPSSPCVSLLFSGVDDEEEEDDDDFL